MNLHCITGGAGFIATTLTERLLASGATVIAVDDLSRGRRAFLDRFEEHPRFSFTQLDCNDRDALTDALRPLPRDGHIWHLAANSDIPAGNADPRIDLAGTFMTTFHVLESMRALGIANLHFASSSAVYGDLGDAAAAEDAGPVEPISNYGAMKLASEAAIRAAVEAWLPRASVFRFPNVVGVPATHGVIVDLVRKLGLDASVLDVLGDGTQRKPYLHVSELVDAMLFIAANASARYNVFNIGPEDEGVTVRFIAEAVRDGLAPSAALRFGAGNRGWVGDVPRFRYSVDRLRALGWSSQCSSADAIRRAVTEIAQQEAGRCTR